MGYIETFRKQVGLIKALGEDKAYTAWVMGRYLEEPDVESLAAQALTDGPEDKKIDFIYLDRDNRRLIITQGFYSHKLKDSAPANKASDLNTAIAWFISGDLDLVPETIQIIVKECRDAIENDEVDAIELIYVHNLPESVNVARELQTAESHLTGILGTESILVTATELGSARIQHLHDSQESHIEVKDEIDFPSKIAFQEEGKNWTSYIASVPGIWLHHLYNKYSDDLFSANYRGFLGGGKRRRVNTGIKDSAETRPSDFWAFNNGITVLTVGLTTDKAGKSILSGMSIINGAQTTGSIGSVDLLKRDIKDLKVLCRVIESSDSETIADIVRFNNTQNAITSWDQYSNDPEQKRLVGEFAELGFSYNIKRGFQGVGDQLGIDEAIQPLLAFHGRPQDADRGKNTIFERKPLYQNAFEGKKARHVLFIYTLAKAIDERRLELKAKSNNGSLLAVEAAQLSLMRNLRFKAFFIALMSATIETAIGKTVDPQTIGFTPDAAKAQSLVDLTARWMPLVEALLALLTAANVKDFGGRLSDDVYLQDVAKQLNALLYAMQAAEKNGSFADLVAGS